MTLSRSHALLWSLRIGLLEACSWIGIQFGDYFHADVARASRAYPVAIWGGVFGSIAFWIALKVIRIPGERRFDFWPMLFWGALLMEALWGCQNLLWPLFKIILPNFEVRFWIWAWFASVLGAFLVIQTYFIFVRLGINRLLIKWQDPGDRKKAELKSRPSLLYLIPFGFYEALFGYVTLRAVSVAWSKANPLQGFLVWFGTGFTLSWIMIQLAQKFLESRAASARSVK